MKTCTQCGVAKPETEFHRFEHAPDGRAPSCKACAKERNGRYYLRNRERLLAERRARYEQDPAAARIANAKWKDTNQERHQYLQRRSHLKQLYGMTPERYETLLAAQGEACALCRVPVGDKRLHVDHDHRCCPGRRSCGECIRGLLCQPCNRLLGWFDNNRDAIGSYLTKETV